MGKRASLDVDFITAFSIVFCVLGLKLLFGSKPVTTGSVLLLGSISASAASAWTGTAGMWVQDQVAGAFQNYTTVAGVEGLLSQWVSAAMVRVRTGLAASVVDRGVDEVEVDEL